MERPGSCILVIFGASGDLTERKLMPALYRLFMRSLLPERFAVLGVGRTEMSDEEFRNKLSSSLVPEDNESSGEGSIRNFLEAVSYCRINTLEPSEYSAISSRLEEIDSRLKTGGNYLFYLATSPSVYALTAESLGQQGLARQKNGSGFKRLIVEKPFGSSLSTAIELDRKLLKIFDEEQIFRIDHYLGKETVQNLFVARFANGIFEPVWNRNYVHHIEVTACESIGIENRGGYYEKSGALRDMVQNHLLQLVALVAMEPPSSFQSTPVRNEKLKVFESLRPIEEKDVAGQVIRGQYTSSTVRGEKIKGYRDERDVKSDSRTETYAAMKFFIDNWRWSGVPFYIRTGKRLPTTVSEIVIHFKPTPH
ncbi:MAG: glucose-6-phosphate dehydrogenase, partial [Syntrophothermus sp.]